MITILSLASKYNEAFDQKLFLLTKAPVTFRELGGYFFQHGFNLRAPNLVFFFEEQHFPSHLCGKWLLILLFPHIFLSKIIN